MFLAPASLPAEQAGDEDGKFLPARMPAQVPVYFLSIAASVC